MELTLTVTILILVILTLVIFAFVFVVFRSIQKSEHILVNGGSRDVDIIQEKDHEKTKSYKAMTYFSNIVSAVIALFALSMMSFSLYFKFSNNLAFINGHAQMVIASNSMSFVAKDGQLAVNGGYLTSDMVSQEFKRGDILTVETVPEQSAFTTFKTDSTGAYVYETSAYFSNLKTLVPVQDGILYGIYGYSNDYTKKVIGNSWNSETSIVIHRLVRISLGNSGNVILNFAGDAVGGMDSVNVSYSDLVAHYNNGGKIQGFGYLILFFQSIFGIYAVVSSIVMLLLSELYTRKIQIDYDERWEHIEHSRLVVYEEVQAQQSFIDEKWLNERRIFVERMKDITEAGAAPQPAITPKDIAVEPIAPSAPINSASEEVPEAVSKANPAPAPTPEKPKAVKKVLGKKGVVVKIMKSDDDGK